ncbi:putative colanic acid biosysnthesis UDP-glucose lipid carrier transferase [bacterium A37T11]|nr:putative colanic acid biosysnthesis UDP-glucose lipid carrier transferase [bacterium A37T11]
MARNSRNIFYFTHLLVDNILIILAFFSVVWIFNIVAFPELDLLEMGFLLYLLTGWYISSSSYGLYVDRSEVNVIREVFRAINCIVIQGLLAVLFVFTLQLENKYSRLFVITYVVLLGFLIPFSKFVLKRVFKYIFNRGFLCKRAIVIGDGNGGLNFYQYLKKNRFYGYQVVRYVKGEVLQRTRGSVSAALNRIAIGETGLGRIDEVFITESEQPTFNTREIANALAPYSVRLRIIPHVAEMLSHNPRVGQLGGFPLISLRQEPLEDIYNLTAKRVFDIFFSLFILLSICSWLFPIIALFIKLESKGPVFFRQERWGKRNRRFLCFKFRSMFTAAPDTNTEGKFQQARKNDPRITRIGRFLRKSNLDELPQFLNVLLGDMSVVGPRPHASLMNKESVETIEKYLVRHQAKPGITGWAQVNGLRGESTDPRLLESRVIYDIWYIENWTFWLDLRIIFLTFWKMIIGDKQAY